MAEGTIEKPNFADGMAALLNLATPARVEAEAEAQRKIVASTMPASERVLMIPVGQLRESPTNPRKTIGDLDDLTTSMRSVGVLQALLGRRVDGAKGVEIVFGHRRFRAAKLAGLEEVPVDVRVLTDNEVLEAQAVENLQRSDLHELEEAEHYGRMKTAGYTVETIAAKVGKSAGWVHGRVKLLALGPEARTAVYDRTIPASVALPLARIPGHDLQAKALHAITRGLMSARAMIEVLQKDFCRNLKGSPFDLKDEVLDPEAGSCRECPKNSNNLPTTLFGDFDGGIERQGVCLDTTCYARKCKAQYARTAEKAKEAGAEVLSSAETKKVIAFGKLTYGAPYVMASDIIHGDTKKRTWEQLLERLDEADRPKVVIGPDDQTPGQVVRLFDRKTAMKAARDMGCKWAGTPASKTPEEKKSNALVREKERAAATKGAAVLRVTKLTIPRLVEHWRTKAGLPELRVLAAEIFARSSTMFEADDREACLTGFDMPGAREGKEGKVPTERAVEKWIAESATATELIAFVLVQTCYEKWTDTEDDFEDSFSELAGRAGANLKAAVRSEQENAVLEADKKKAKK